MTLSEIAEEVARRVGAPPKLAWGFLREATKLFVEVLEEGGEIKIRDLGTLRWVPVSPKKIHNLNRGQATQVDSGRKLKFIPAKNFRTRRENSMSEDEEMTKLGVVLDEDKTKEAVSDGQGERCPVCRKQLDGDRSCPEHGTEPLERKTD